VRSKTWPFEEIRVHPSCRACSSCPSFSRVSGNNAGTQGDSGAGFFASELLARKNHIRAAAHARQHKARVQGLRPRRGKRAQPRVSTWVSTQVKTLGSDLVPFQGRDLHGLLMLTHMGGPPDGKTAKSCAWQTTLPNGTAPALRPAIWCATLTLASPSDIPRGVTIPASHRSTWR
jgi:hypothetical protein